MKVKWIVLANSIALSFALSSVMRAVALSDLQSKVIELNNKGVQELNQSHFAEAVQYLKQAVNLDRQYVLARDNLAITYNNYGLAVANDPPQCLKWEHLAFLVNPNNSTTRQNVEQAIRNMG